MPSEKALKVLEHFDQGERIFAKIAREVGLTKERVRQIATTIGIKSGKRLNRSEVFTKTCPVCQSTFSTKREKRIYCGKSCTYDAKFLHTRSPYCRMCKSKSDLLKAGKNNFLQHYICRTCVQKYINKKKTKEVFVETVDKPL